MDDERFFYLDKEHAEAEWSELAKEVDKSGMILNEVFEIGPQFTPTGGRLALLSIVRGLQGADEGLTEDEIDEIYQSLQDMIGQILTDLALLSMLLEGKVAVKVDQERLVWGLLDKGEEWLFAQMMGWEKFN